jgi:hypothetical protein
LDAPLDAPHSPAMDNRVVYTRVYSESSAGQLASGKAPKGDPLSKTALLDEFRNHANKSNRKPTALVSGSNRIVDTLRRALEKHYKDKESSEDIWIAFMEVPPTINEIGTPVHSAKELAEICGLQEPNRFSHEVVFEWAIPNKYVVHKVSLHTLMKRGFQEHWFLRQSTREVRQYISGELEHHAPWDIGITLGFFARSFGARAPLAWISYQLFYDCIRAKILDNDVVRLRYAHGHAEMVDFQYFCDLDDGIDTCLHDWWLTDIDNFTEYEEFKEQRDVIEDSMICDLVEFWETWHYVNCDGSIEELSAKGKSIYNKAKNKLMVEHEEKRASVEAEAVDIGL